MNEYCKNYLRHSWGKSPERKELERQYNINYYKANRSRILQRAKERASTTPATNYDITVAPLHLYDGADDFIGYSKKALYDALNVGNTAVSAVKKTANSFKAAVAFVKKKLQTPIEIIKNTKAYKAVSNFFKKVKYYESKATI